jgi:hypothetical protein
MAEHDLSSSAIGSSRGERYECGVATAESGSGRTVTYRLDIQSQAVLSGLQDMATQHPVYLFLVGGTVFGREGRDETTAEFGEIVFALSVDVHGKITRDQLRPVAAPGTLASPGLITLTAIISCEDGTTDRAAAKIAGTLEFAVEPSERRRHPRGQTGDADANGDAAAPIADIIYELTVAMAGADTGLIDAATDRPIFLFVDGRQVVARLGDDVTAAASGEIAFVISVDGAGNVLLDQQRDVIEGQNRGTLAAASLVRPDLVRLKARMRGPDGKREVAYANIAGALRFGERGARAAMSSDLAYIGLRQAEKSRVPHTIM